MPSNGASAEAYLSRFVGSPTVRLVAGLVLLILLLVLDLAGGPRIRIGGLMVGVPALSAVFLGPGAVLILVGATYPCLVFAALNNGQLDTVNFPVVLSTTTLIGGASVLAASVRQRRERELAQARWVAAITQRALLRPLPTRLGPFAVASVYLSADREAAIGGDLYAAADIGGGRLRVLVGDVQGKGMDAVEVTGMLLAAFRRTARLRTPLRELPASLDESLRDDLADVTGPAAVPGGPPPPPPEPGGSTAEPAPRVAPGFLERFVTAVVVDVSPGGESISVANCGHPPPVLLHRGEVLVLESVHPGVPLGLGDLTPETHHLDTYDLAVGDVLLLYTDGVIEARDTDGVFYPLTDRLADWRDLAPADLVTALTADLARYVGRRLGDDVAVVALQRTA